MNPKRPTPRHIIIKMPTFKDEENTKSSERETTNNIQGTPIRLAADFSTETLPTRRQWQEIFQVMKNKGLQPRLLYPARLSIEMEGEIRSFPDKRRLKEYTSTKPTLQDMLKGRQLYLKNNKIFFNGGKNQNLICDEAFYWSQRNKNN